MRHQPDGNAHPSHVIPDDLRPPPSDGRRKKKPVALLLAYVGGKYKGNTHNAHTPRGSTVDDVVEDAMFSWGGDITAELSQSRVTATEMEPKQSHG